MIAPRARTTVVRGLSAVLLRLAASVAFAPLAARADGGLQVMTVSRTSQGVTAVVQVDPAPLAALAKDAASVTPEAPGSTAAAAEEIPATVSPVLDLTSGTPLAVVVG